ALGLVVYPGVARAAPDLDFTGVMLFPSIGVQRPGSGWAHLGLGLPLRSSFYERIQGDRAFLALLRTRPQIVTARTRAQILCRWLLALTFLLVITAPAQPVSRSEQLLRKLETARTPAEAHPLLEQLARALKEGELFGEEARIARLTRRFWEDPAAPSAVRFQ